ncbi:MAG: hypothetical protein JO041_01435 [Acidobacteria bacterium]|nr:hypothetical protein [Acidobacteriota bacterium]
MLAQSRFQNELQLFEANREKWAHSHPAQYVVIHGKEVVGFYAEFENALDAGLRKFERGTFLVKQIFEKEPVYAIY